MFVIFVLLPYLLGTWVTRQQWTGCFLLPFYLELKHVSDRLSASGEKGHGQKEKNKKGCSMNIISIKRSSYLGGNKIKSAIASSTLTPEYSQVLSAAVQCTPSLHNCTSHMMWGVPFPLYAKQTSDHPCDKRAKTQKTASQTMAMSLVSARNDAAKRKANARGPNRL